MVTTLAAADEFRVEGAARAVREINTWPLRHDPRHSVVEVDCIEELRLDHKRSGVIDEAKLIFTLIWARPSAKDQT